MESHDSIHWTAWCVDVWWEPAIFKTAFKETDEDIGNPYEGEMPVACDDRPCGGICWVLTPVQRATRESLFDAL